MRRFRPDSVSSRLRLRLESGDPNTNSAADINPDNIDTS